MNAYVASARRLWPKPARRTRRPRSALCQPWLFTQTEQGTLNFQSWATLGSVTPNDRGEAFFNISTGTNRAYYRFAYVP